MATELWQRIRATREHAKLTQDAIAKRCGIARNAVSLWETSDPTKRTTPTVPNLVVLATLASEMTGDAVSDIAGWLLDDSSDMAPEWRGRRMAVDVGESPAVYGNIPESAARSRKAARLAENFDRLTPAIQAHVLAIVESLAMPASPSYLKWEAEQRKLNNERDSEKKPKK